MGRVPRREIPRNEPTPRSSSNRNGPEVQLSPRPAQGATGAGVTLPSFHELTKAIDFDCARGMYTFIQIPHHPLNTVSRFPPRMVQKSPPPPSCHDRDSPLSTSSGASDGWDSHGTNRTSPDQPEKQDRVNPMLAPINGVHERERPRPRPRWGSNPPRLPSIRHLFDVAARRDVNCPPIAPSPGAPRRPSPEGGSRRRERRRIPSHGWHALTVPVQRPALHVGTPQRPKRRGNLPRETTERLQAWFVDHIGHPYPTEDEKQILMAATKLTMSQVSNWFINARRRKLPKINGEAEAEARLRTQLMGPSTLAFRPA